MQFSKNKLEELIESLSKKQQDDLVVFVNLPSLNFSKKEKKLFEDLFKNARKKRFKNWDSEAFRTQKKLSKKDWNYFSAKITGAVYQYLSGKLNPPEEMPSGYPLARYFRAKGLDKNYRTLRTKMEKNLRKNGYGDSKEHYHRSLIQYLMLEDERNDKKNPERILEYQKCLDDFYFENKLRIACELLNRGVVVNLKSDADWIQLLSFYDKKGGEMPAAIQMYRSIYEMLSDKDQNEKSYEKAKGLIAECYEEFSPSERIEIYEFLMNFCIIRGNRGSQYFADEYLNFIEIRRAQNLILIDKKLSETKFNNIIYVMLMTDNLDKAEEFIAEYEWALEKSIRQNAVNFNLAQIEFQRGNFDKAHDLIIGFEPNDFFKKIKHDKLLLKIYFELGEIQLLENKLKTFKNFVRKTRKLSDGYRTIFLNFAQNLSKLIQKKAIIEEELKNQLPPRDIQWFAKKTGIE